MPPLLKGNFHFFRQPNGEIYEFPPRKGPPLPAAFPSSSNLQQGQELQSRVATSSNTGPDLRDDNHGSKTSKIDLMREVDKFSRELSDILGDNTFQNEEATPGQKSRDDLWNAELPAISEQRSGFEETDDHRFERNRHPRGENDAMLELLETENSGLSPRGNADRRQFMDGRPHIAPEESSLGRQRTDDVEEMLDLFKERSKQNDPVFTEERARPVHSVVDEWEDSDGEERRVVSNVTEREQFRELIDEPGREVKMVSVAGESSSSSHRQVVMDDRFGMVVSKPAATDDWEMDEEGEEGRFRSPLELLPNQPDEVYVELSPGHVVRRSPLSGQDWESSRDNDSNKLRLSEERFIAISRDQSQDTTAPLNGVEDDFDLLPEYRGLKRSRSPRSPVRDSKSRRRHSPSRRSSGEREVRERSPPRRLKDESSRQVSRRGPKERESERPKEREHGRRGEDLGSSKEQRQTRDQERSRPRGEELRRSREREIKRSREHGDKRRSREREIRRSREREQRRSRDREQRRDRGLRHSRDQDHRRSRDRELRRSRDRENRRTEVYEDPYHYSRKVARDAEANQRSRRDMDGSPGRERRRHRDRSPEPRRKHDDTKWLEDRLLSLSGDDKRQKHDAKTNQQSDRFHWRRTDDVKDSSFQVVDEVLASDEEVEVSEDVASDNIAENKSARKAEPTKDKEATDKGKETGQKTGKQARRRSIWAKSDEEEDEVGKAADVLCEGEDTPGYFRVVVITDDSLRHLHLDPVFDSRIRFHSLPGRNLRELIDVAKLELEMSSTPIFLLISGGGVDVYSDANRNPDRVMDGMKRSFQSISARVKNHSSDSLIMLSRVCPRVAGFQAVRLAKQVNMLIEETNARNGVDTINFTWTVFINQIFRPDFFERRGQHPIPRIEKQWYNIVLKVIIPVLDMKIVDQEKKKKETDEKTKKLPARSARGRVQGREEKTKSGGDKTQKPANRTGDSVKEDQKRSGGRSQGRQEKAKSDGDKIQKSASKTSDCVTPDLKKSDGRGQEKQEKAKSDGNKMQKPANKTDDCVTEDPKKSAAGDPPNASNKTSGHSSGPKEDDTISNDEKSTVQAKDKEPSTEKNSVTSGQGEKHEKREVNAATCSQKNGGNPGAKKPVKKPKPFEAAAKHSEKEEPSANAGAAKRPTNKGDTSDGKVPESPEDDKEDEHIIVVSKEEDVDEE